MEQPEADAQMHSDADNDAIGGGDQNSEEKKEERDVGNNGNCR